MKSISIGILVVLCLTFSSFNAEDAEAPRSAINNVFTDTLSLKSLSELEELSINLDQEGLVVVSFRAVHAPSKGEASLKSFNGSSISDNWILPKIKNSVIGDRILIDKVTAKDSQGAEVLCLPALYTLIE